MDLNLTASERQFRDELRAWLKANVPPAWSGDIRGDEHIDFLRGWQRKLHDAGWVGVSWPKDYGGRGATPIEQAIYQEELAHVEAPPLINLIALSIIGPTIMMVGTDEQKKRYLPKILSAEEIWCQGFSEPNAGSDVASLSTRATREGDFFVVNGQKIWTSVAHVAHWCLLLTRTNSGKAKHEGLTMLLVDMKSEGVQVRPIRQMSGSSEFNEIFFSNVRVPATHVLGTIDEGWSVAVTTLLNERANLGAGLYVHTKQHLDRLITKAKQLRRNGRPLTEDPVVRQKLAQAHVDLEVYRLNTVRALSRLAKTGIPGPEGSTLKLFWSEINQRVAHLATEIIGPQSQLWDCDEGRWTYQYLRCRGNTIEAGTSEVQRNIIGQRVLGLPRSY